MNKSTIWLKQLSISGFRGVRDSLDFSGENALDAPLTLIYAPNGTGKTTLCDAVELLTTCELSRVGDRSEIGSDRLRCMFSGDDVETFIQGELGVGGKPLRLRLQATDDGRWEWKWDWEREPGKLVSAGKSEVLGVIAPDVTLDSATWQTQNPARIEALNMTRFLSRRTLEKLTGANLEDQEARETSMADLLGTQHLRGVGKKLDKLNDKLGPTLRTLEKRCKKLDEDRHRISNEGDSASAEALAAQAFASLEEVATKLVHIGSDESQPAELIEHSLAERHALVVDRYERLRKQNESRRSLVESVVREMGAQVDQWKEDHQEFRKTIESKVVKLDELDKKRKDKLDKKKPVVVKRNEFQTKSTWLARLKERLDEAKELLATVTSATSLGDSYRQSTWSRLVVFADANPGGADRVRSLRGLLDDVDETRSKKWSEIPELQSFVDGANEQLSAWTIEELKHAVAERERELRKLNDQYNKRSGHLDRLQQAVHDVMQHVDHTQECPVCRHDWGGVDELRDALENGLSELPNALDELKRRVDQKRDEVAAAKDLFGERRKLADQSAKLNERCADWSAFQARASALSVALEDVDAGEVTAHLRKELALAELSRAIERSRAVFTDVQSTLSEADLEADRGAEATWQTWVNHVLIIVNNGRQQISTQIDELNSTLKAFNDELQNVDSEIVAQRDERRQDKERLEERDATLERAQQSWRQLDGFRELTTANVDAWKRQLAQDHVTLERLGETLAAAEALVTKQESTQRREKELERIDKQRTSVRAKLDQLQQICKTATSTKAKVIEMYEEHERAQLKALSDPVNALFALAQANAVYDELDFSEWPTIRARAGSENFEPQGSFSQGQRQDLALALFLARARTIGGTFFLDEPLIYLDDLNRVALLDILRAMALSQGSGPEPMNLVVTTASRSLMRHLVEKFANLSGSDGRPLMKVIELLGNSRVGVTASSKWIGRAH